jgi:hypothetical protein
MFKPFPPKKGKKPPMPEKKGKGSPVKGMKAKAQLEGLKGC